MSDIAVIVPVLNRPQNARPLYESLIDSTGRARLVFVMSMSDTDAQHDAVIATGADMLFIEEPPGPGDYARKTQAGYDHTDELLVLLAADDLRFHPGWLEAVELAADRYDVGVIGTNDTANPAVLAGNHSTHPIVRRCYIDEHGGVVGYPGMIYWAGYSHNYCDNELVATAVHRGCYYHCHAAIIEHLHPLWRTAPDDATYRRGLATSSMDARLFESRRRLWEHERVPA